MKQHVYEQVKSDLTGEAMIKVDNRHDLNKELKKNDKVLTLFYASWCPYCMAFVPTFNKKTGDFTAGTIVHVLLDDYDNPLWDDYNVVAVPTVIFFEKGKSSKRLDGNLGLGLNEKQLMVWLQEFKAK
jgi:thioredoxin 1